MWFFAFKANADGRKAKRVVNYLGKTIMKPVISVISAFLLLAFASSTVLAYSGSECEVNDCSQPSKPKSNKTKGQAMDKSEAGAAAKAKPATLKDQAKGHAKDKVMEMVPAKFQGLTVLLK